VIDRVVEEGGFASTKHPRWNGKQGLSLYMPEWQKPYVAPGTNQVNP